MNAFNSAERAAFGGLRFFSAASSFLGNASYAKEALSAWQLKAMEKINDLRDLPENWNSYGSRSLSDDTLDAAIRIVTTACEIDADVPRVMPIAGGGIQLNWERGAREVDIEIDRNLTQSLLLTRNGESQEFPSVNIDQLSLRAILTWVRQE